jgi:hypothetical protein
MIISPCYVDFKRYSYLFQVKSLFILSSMPDTGINISKKQSPGFAVAVLSIAGA